MSSQRVQHSCGIRNEAVGQIQGNERLPTIHLALRAESVNLSRSLGGGGVSSGENQSDQERQDI